MIKFYINDITPENERGFDITEFPDKTHQVWHLKILEDVAKIDTLIIDWKFENQSEFLDVIQLATLLKHSFGKFVTLNMEFFPFSRQDKPISNESTFAAWPFINLLHNCKLFDNINTVDMHNKMIVSGSPIFNNETPNKRINEVLELSKTDVVCFPDKGASQRGYSIDPDVYGTVTLAKKRNQTTGEIEGLKFENKLGANLTGLVVTIIDDLCDGGRTFIEGAKILKEAGASKVFLYTTHGIYSKGTQILFDNGLDRVFNYKSEVLST